MRALLVTAALFVAGCDAKLTSVGAVEPHIGSADAGADARITGSTAPPDARPTEPSSPPDARASVDAPVHETGPSFYVEAEDGVLTTGFTLGNDAAASGGEYIISAAGAPSNGAPGPARATYTLELDAADTYVIWGRIHSPDVARNAFWFRMDTDTWRVWRLATGEDFYWGPLHENVAYNTPIRFPLSAGTHVLEFANFIDGVSLDRLYFTTGTERPMGDDTACRPPDSVKLGGVCVASCGSQGGTTCGDDVCAGRTPIPAYDCALCCIGP